MSCSSYDVAVAGSGPSGSIAALSLARLGWNVCQLESAEADRDRNGETLPPESTPLLRSLDLLAALERSNPIESPGVLSWWGGPQPVEHDFLANPYGSGWHICRTRFDSELRAEALRAGVSTYRRFTVSQRTRDGSWWDFGHIRAKFLIDASGRNGLRFDGGGDRDIEDVLLALVLRISQTENHYTDRRMIIEATPRGWWYAAPTPGAGAVAMFFTGRPEYAFVRRLAVEKLMEGAPHTQLLWQAGQIADQRWCSVSSSVRRKMQGEGWVSTGDSASSYDPLSGRGVFKALRHGSLAARAVDAQLRGSSDALQQYEARVRHEFREYAAQRREHYRLETRWPTSSFWGPRQSGDEGV